MRNYELGTVDKKLVAAALCAASFFILHSLFLPTPALAYSASQHPDKNIKVRRWEPITGQLNLIEFSHEIDQRAPQLSTLIAEEATPTIKSLYQVYEWDWATNTRNGLYSRPADAPLDFATLVGFEANGKSILVPESGYDLGSGLEVFVLYADADSITLQYTCDDSTASGYTIHLVGFNIDGSLLALYNQLDQAGRESLPVLKAGARIGVGKDEDILVSIRDTGSFMDPRWRNDWWQRLNAVSGQPLELTELSFDECGGLPDDEGNCHMPDENLTTCCDLPTPPSGLNQLIDWVKQYVSDLTLPLPYSLTTTNDFKISKKFEEETDYFYGSAHSEFEPGVFFRLAPPNLLEEYFPNEGDETKTRKAWAKWTIELDRPSGGEGEDALNDGKTKDVEPYRLAAVSLRNFLVAIPKVENGSSSYNGQPKETLASISTTNVGGNPTSNPEVLGSADLCPAVVEYQTKETCTPQDAEGADLTIGRFLGLISGGLRLFPKIADLDIIGHSATNVETDGEGAAAQDPHYEDGGFLEIFRLPTEDPYEDRTGKGGVGISLQIGPITVNVPVVGPVTFGPINIPVGKKDLQLRHEGAVTEALEGENKVWDKLTPPQAENGTSSYQRTDEPAIYLASNPSVQGTTYYPQNTSLAEKIGRTLGRWLSKLIAL